MESQSVNGLKAKLPTLECLVAAQRDVDDPSGGTTESVSAFMHEEMVL